MITIVKVSSWLNSHSWRKSNKMKLTTVRHGETENNVSEILISQLEGDLTKKGKDQAKLLGKRLSKEKFDIIYCSDSKRTKDTAKEIIKYHKNTPIVYTKELREIHRGDKIGEHGMKLWEEYKKSEKPFAEFKPKGGESPLDLVNRIKEFVEKIKAKHSHKKVLFITHGGVNRSLRDIVLDQTPSEEQMESGKNNNCCVNIFDLSKEKPKIVLYNCTKHLTMDKKRLR